MGSSQQFSLRWNNYLKYITDAFDTLRTHEDLVDVTLSCEGKRIRAHKMLLSACSTYLRDLFKENPCQHPVIIFRNVKFDDLAALVKFMYQGEVNVVQEQLASFLTTAELLEVKGLTQDTAHNNDMVIEDDVDLPNEPEVQLQNLSGTIAINSKGGSSPSSPLPYHSVDVRSDTPPTKKRKCRENSSSSSEKSSNKDKDTTNSEKSGADPVEIIPLMPNLKLEMPEYLEQDGSSCSYDEQNLSESMSRSKTDGNGSEIADHEQKPDISQTFYSSNQPVDLDAKAISELGHMLSKPSTSSERAQDAAQDYIEDYFIQSADEIPHTSIFLPDPLSFQPRHEDYMKKNLLDTLQRSTQGKLILAKYRDDGALNDTSRNQLADIIISTELSSDLQKKLSVERINKLADCVLQLFPSEEKSVWICNSSKDKKVSYKGKLLTRYYNVRRSLIRHKLIAKHHAEKETTAKEDLLEISSDVKDTILWLQNNIKPWPKVLQAWSMTTAARVSALRQNPKEPGQLLQISSLLEYYSHFPCLRLPEGYNLLEIDFNNTFPNAKFKLSEVWNKFAQFVLYKLKDKDPMFKECDIISDNGKLKIFLNLTKLFPVITAVNKKGLGQWRPSRREILESFILHVTNVEEMEVALNIRKEKTAKYGLQMQPQIVVVGPTIDAIQDHFVVVDNIYYRVENSFRAVDITYKVFHALHANYPPECEQVWLFIQKTVYNMNTERERKLTTVHALLSEYNVFINKWF